MAKSKNIMTQIKKATRRTFTTEEKIRIILEGSGLNTSDALTKYDVL